MSRLMSLIVLAALILATAGCASMQTPKQKLFAGFPYRHDGFDFRKVWKASPSPDGLVVQGILKNVRFFRVEDVEITVSLLRNGDKVISEETDFLLGTFDNDEYINFSLLLKNAAASPGDLLHFRIKYRAIEGNGIYNWISDFTADAVTGVPIPNLEGSPS